MAEGGQGLEEGGPDLRKKLTEMVKKHSSVARCTGKYILKQKTWKELREKMCMPRFNAEL